MIYDFADGESALSAWSFDSAFADILAIVRDAPREAHLTATPSLIRPQDVVAASSLRVDIDQRSVLDSRFAGEGADPNVIGVSKVSIKSSFEMPMFAPALGYIDPALATIWALTRLAWWGTASAAIGSLLNLDSPLQALPAGQAALYTDNVADFAGLALPVAIQVSGPQGSGDVTESLIVTGVSKKQRMLNLAAPTAYAHAFGSRIVSLPNTMDGPAAEPAFSLVSLQNGMLTPSLINKLTITANVNEPIKIEVEVMSIGVVRTVQVAFREQRQKILNSLARLTPSRIVNGTSVTLTAAAAHAGSFGLSSALGDPLFGGFQGVRLPPLAATGISITVDNHLEEIWTTHSLKAWPQRQRENSFPQALASSGRTVSGSLRYSTAIDPWIVAERLAGPSALNGGGLVVNFGPCQVTLSEIAWQPSKIDARVEDKPARSLDWTLVAETSDVMPPLEYARQL